MELFSVLIIASRPIKGQDGTVEDHLAFWSTCQTHGTSKNKGFSFEI